MKLPEQILDLVGTAKINWLWEHTLLATEDTDEHQDEINKIKWGYTLKFNIQYITNDHQLEDIKNNKIIINNKEFDLEEYWEELEQRKQEMRKIIYQNIEDDDIPSEPRIK